MGDPRADLERVADLLEQAYQQARSELQANIDDNVAQARYAAEPPRPEQMKDPNGRHLLLDALVALVNARTALGR